MKIDFEVLLKICEVLNVPAERFYEDYLGKQKSTQTNKKFNISNSEIIRLQKYHALDEHGKKMVDFTLNEEYNRCMSETAKEIIEERSTIQIKYSYVPASAGQGEFLDDENIEIRDYPDTIEARQADIVIPVDGDSMEPMFSDGDELYVRLQPAVEIGEIGIFIIDGKGYVKEFAEDRLISLNTEYDDVYPCEYSDCRCVGKVIGKAELK
jgi:phage repressor protein C with HTH and peptisase S24 domain